MRGKLVKIDSNSMRAAFQKRGINFDEASKRLGRNKNYVSYLLNRGVMTYSTAIMMNEIFGIKLDEITGTIDIKAGINLEELYKTVYNAVRDGMRDALNEK